jgi:hypothetical protein
VNVSTSILINPRQTRVFRLTLVSPQNQRVALLGFSCDIDVTSYTMDYTFDDQAETALDPCTHDNGTFKPDNPLSLFNGTSALGTWVLVVDDPTIGGEIYPDQRASPTPRPSPTTATQPPLLYSWSIELCLTNGEQLIFSGKGLIGDMHSNGPGLTTGQALDGGR